VGNRSESGQQYLVRCIANRSTARSIQTIVHYIVGICRREIGRRCGGVVHAERSLGSSEFGANIFVPRFPAVEPEITIGSTTKF